MEIGFDELMIIAAVVLIVVVGGRLPLASRRSRVNPTRMIRKTMGGAFLALLAFGGAILMMHLFARM